MDNQNLLLILTHRTICKRQFFNFSLVCRRWKEAVEHWCNNQNSIESLAHQFPKLRKSPFGLGHFTRLKELVLGECPIVYPPLLSTVWSLTLTSLTLYGCMEALPSQMWIAINKLTALRTLCLIAILPWSYIPDEMPVFGQLSEFSIDFYKSDIVPLIRYFGEHMRHFSLDNCIIVPHQLRELLELNPNFGSSLTQLTLGRYILSEVMDDIHKPDNFLLSFLINQVKDSLTDLRLRSLQEFNIESLIHISKLTKLKNLELEVDLNVFCQTLQNEQEIRLLKPFSNVKSLTIHNTVEGIFSFEDFTTIFPVLFPSLENITFDYYSSKFSQLLSNTKQQFFPKLKKVSTLKFQQFHCPTYMIWIERFYYLLDQLDDVNNELDNVSLNNAEKNMVEDTDDEV